jgi:2-polyprenyl-3-methyl-5-hydroxy-6-metoxy-1,4-benzoquinol methylase
VKTVESEALPQSKDWDHYWSLDKTKRFTQVSWSKKRIMRILERYVLRGGRALDAGCGSGFFSEYFIRQGMHTHSLDYSQEALKVAEAMTGGRAHLVKGDLLDAQLLKEMSGQFDLIFSDGLLEHFSFADQNKIITHLKNLLSAQGVLVTFVPNRWSPWELIRPLYMPGIEETPFILKDLLHLQDINGLRVVEKGGINTFPWAFSPDKTLGPLFGMLLYTITSKK